MGQKDLGMLYDALLDLGMTTDVAVLNWCGQTSYLMQVFAMQTIFSRHSLSAIRGLRYLHDIWSGLGVEDGEHLTMASLNSCFEKGGHSIVSFCDNSLMRLVLTGRFATELYKLWRAFHRERRELHSCPSYVMVSMVGRDFFLTQFIKSHSLLFEDTISCIFSSKNFCLASYIDDLKAFQFDESPCWWYLLRLSVHS